MTSGLRRYSHLAIKGLSEFLRCKSFSFKNLNVFKCILVVMALNFVKFGITISGR